MNTIESIIDRRVAFWTTSIIAVSNATRNSLVQRRDFDLTRKPITVIYNGLDEKSEPVKNRFRSRFGISPEQRVAVVLGRGELYKGHEELLRSIALLPVEIKKDFLLVIVGNVDAARRECLADLAKRLCVDELVRFCGFVDLDSSEIIVDVDLLVCVTQDFEGFGYTVLEAMSVGTPVATTSVGAIPEFCDERYGIVIRPGSIQAISDAIELVLSDPISAAHRVSSAKVHSQQFSGERMAMEIYRELKY
jgi:glycosyltransferase involved in cell wall biosynthesis